MPNAPSSTDFDSLLAGLPPETLPALLAGLERWEAGTLSPAAWNIRFLPHYFGRFPPADFHADLDRDLDGLHLRRGSRRSYVAPRGGAKSTWVTLAYPLRAALEGWEPYTTILSDSSEQAVELLRHVKAEVEGNARLAGVYPDAAGAGPEWKESRIRLRNGAVVEALGAGKKIRGRRNRSERPSLVIFDDVQSNEDVASPTLRERAWEWATREVIPAGDERTNFLAVGSAIHREAVSVRLGKLAGWAGRTCKAVHRWPDRMDLWLEFERRATNILDDDRAAAAAAFYAANRAEMDRGAVTYWPGRYAVADLMLRRAEIGRWQFEAEYQGVPGAAEKAHWAAHLFDAVLVPSPEWPDDLIHRVAWYDGAGGETNPKRGDYHALVLLGWRPTEDALYFDAHLWKGTESEACERLDAVCRPFQPIQVGMESNFGMGWVANHYRLWLQLQNARRSSRDFLPPLPVTGYPVRDPKPSRIRLIDSFLSRGLVRVKDTPGGRLLVDQYRDWPHGEHDDGPDAAAGAIWLASKLARK